MNGDGSLDIIVGNSGDDGTQDFVYLNDGSGHFPLSRNLGAAKGTTGLALADMNGDGALDVIAAHQPCAECRLCQRWDGQLPGGA